MKLIPCQFNRDSGSVEPRFDDGTALDIVGTVMEYEYAHTMPYINELDWLAYNAPLECAQLVLQKKAAQYLKAVLSGS